MWARRRTSAISKARARPTSTAPPISTAPTTSRPCPAINSELALWLESDRMGFLLEKLDREKLTNQRDVVRNERRQGENQPYQLSEEEVYHLLFPARPSLLRIGDRLACRHRSGAPAGCAQLLPQLLHAQQCEHRDCRGLRQGQAEAVGGEVFRPDPEGAGAAAGHGDDSAHHQPEDCHCDRYSATAAR